MIELLLTIVVVILICQLVFSFIPRLDQRVVGLIILLIILFYVFGHRWPFR